MKFDKLVRELVNADEKMEESDIICHLFLILPSKYDAVITALETVEDKSLTINLVKSKLLGEETKMKIENKIH